MSRGILFEMYRHELIALVEEADDRSGPGSRTLLTEPPSLAYNELAGSPRWRTTARAT